MVIYGAVSEDLRFPAFQTSAVWMICVQFGGLCEWDLFKAVELPFAMCQDVFY